MTQTINFEEFDKKHKNRVLIDSNGYLEACVGIKDYEIYRLSKSVLKPSNFDNMLGASVLNGRDGIMSGYIERLPQNLLIHSDISDFSPNTYRKVSRNVPNANYVRLFKISSIPARFYLQNTSRETLVSENILDKPVIKWKIVRETQELVVQFGKWPTSRSEFFSMLLNPATKRFDSESAQKVNSIIGNEDLSIFPKEQPLWCLLFLKNLKASLSGDTSDDERRSNYRLVEQFIYTHMIEPISGFVSYPLIMEEIPPYLKTVSYFDTKHAWNYQQLTGYFEKKSTENITFYFEEGLTKTFLLCKDARFVYEENIKNPSLPIQFNKLFTIQHISVQNTEKIQYEIIINGKKENILHYLKHTPIHKDTLRTHLSQLLKGSTFKSEAKTFQFSVIESEETFTNGFIYTLDEGIKTGVPFTHFSDDKKTFYLGESSDIPKFNDVKNMADNIYSFDIETLLSQPATTSATTSEGNGEAINRYRILSLLHALESKHIQCKESSRALPAYLLGHSSLKVVDNNHEIDIKLIILRCQLMFIVKLFPVSHVHISDTNIWDDYGIPEHRHLIRNSFVDITDSKTGPKCVINADTYNMLPASELKPKAFRNAEYFNLQKMTLDLCTQYLVEISKNEHVGPVVELHIVNSYLVCKNVDNSLSWSADTVFELSYLPERRKKMKKHLFKNELLPHKCPSTMDDQEVIENFFKTCETIPIISSTGNISILPNRKFDHPLTMVCPIKPVYRSTERGNHILLLRPFPTLEEIRSMIRFCEDKESIIFREY